MEKLLNGTGTPENKPNIPDNSEFKAVVEESKQKIHEAAAPPPKKTGPGRRPGRPPKDASASQAQATPLAPPGPATPPPDITAMLVTPVAILGAIPAAKTGIDDLKLTEHEAVEIARSLNGILQAFIPDLSRMSPKTSALFVAGITIGSVALSKYAIYAEKKGKSVDKPVSSVDKNLKIVDHTPPPQKPQVADDAPIMPPGGVSAMDAFRKE